MTLRHITGAEVRHRQKNREREREIKREREREGKKPLPTERTEIEIFSMMGFDSVTFSFLALLVNKSHKKLIKAKFKKSFQLRNKKSQNHFLSQKFCQVTHLRDLKSFVGQLWSLNSEKAKKILNKLGNNYKFLQILLKFKTLILLEPSLYQETIQHNCFMPKIVPLPQRFIHLEHNFPKI